MLHYSCCINSPFRLGNNWRFEEAFDQISGGLDDYIFMNLIIWMKGYINWNCLEWQFFCGLILSSVSAHWVSWGVLIVKNTKRISGHTWSGISVQDSQEQPLNFEIINWGLRVEILLPPPPLVSQLDMVRVCLMGNGHPSGGTRWVQCGISLENNNNRFISALGNQLIPGPSFACLCTNNLADLRCGVEWIFHHNPPHSGLDYRFGFNVSISGYTLDSNEPNEESIPMGRGGAAVYFLLRMEHIVLVRANCPIHFCDFDIRSVASVENSSSRRTLSGGRWSNTCRQGRRSHPQLMLILW